MSLKRPILLQGAMEVEVAYFKEVVENLEIVDLYGYEFYKGTYNGYPVVISKTKVGILEAGISTFVAITNFNPIVVINQGTAGANTESLNNFDIVIGSECININSYITKSREEKEGSAPLEWELLTFKDGRDELIKYKADEELLKIAVNCKDKYKMGKVVLGIVGSGDCWDNEIDRLKWFNEKYNVLCEDMETVSVYNICNKLNIPAIAIRIISDNGITKEEYNRNTGIESQKYSLELVKELISKL